MLGREYLNRVEIWEEQSVSDGYGGFITEDVYIRKVWAKITTSSSIGYQSGYKFQQFGLNDFKNPVLFSVRAKINLVLTEKHFIKYKSKKYFVKGIENVNLEAIELNIYTDEI